ncbi:hypothetical protein GCM10027515_32670 [Schumannella luteola]|uniref:Uncharacterized protein n=1 Tax=Schumannella luteola TaxID=472059 RepID=A0A852Y941_9MICO|nr:hypothetical protein [Schumannella luteola]NYG98933.1 hypothetical protein [Schumannella luteola]TPX06307.1 hypothetical protein FJ656_01310 [Schumannella luteola]
MTATWAQGAPAESRYSGVGFEPAAEAAGIAVSGWARVAVAVHAVGPTPAPVVMRLDVASYAPILIDFRQRAFEAKLPIGQYPSAPESVLVHQATMAEGDAAVFPLPGTDLDKLLWRVGFTCFGDNPAPWIIPGERYKLNRWPNFVELTHHMDHIRMAAALANAHYTADELAAAAGTDRSSAQRLINAFTLMRVVEASAVAAVPVTVPERADAPRSLFRRLREKLGM